MEQEKKEMDTLTERYEILERKKAIDKKESEQKTKTVEEH